MGKIINVRMIGDPILKSKCTSVKVNDIKSEEIKDIISDMKTTFDFSTKSLGMSASQIGIDKRIIIVGTRKIDVKYNDFEKIKTTIMITPKWKKIHKSLIYNMKLA